MPPRLSLTPLTRFHRIDARSAHRMSGRPLPGSKQTKGDAIAAGDVETVPSLSARRRLEVVLTRRYSLVLIAPLHERTADGFDYRVLLLQRHAKSSTFSTAHVFPGGNLDPIDTSPAWNALYPALATPEEVKLQALKLCAVRETFEECGILLAESDSSSGERVWEGVKEEQRRMWRDKVHSNGAAFLDLFKMLSAGDPLKPSRPALSSLQYRANWITPRNMKRRFDTHFMTAVLSSSTLPTSSPPLLSSPIVSSDGKETVSADWLTPSEAIRLTLAHTRTLQGGESEEKSIVLFPPQFYLLGELAGCKNWKELVDEEDVDARGAGKVRRREVRAFEPELKQVETAFGELREATVLPGDPAHSATASMTGILPTARHRTYVLLPTRPKEESWKAKAPLGLTVVGLHREGLVRVLGEQWGDMKEGDVGEGLGRAKL